MPEPLKLMCVLAHPDDESLGNGGMLATYASEGVETYLVTATSGQKGWKGKAEDYPGPGELGRLRTQELRAAGEALGLKRVDVLGYMDGELDEADAPSVARDIATRIREVRPHVVVTFGPDGAYGHPDHIAISQLTAAAIVRAAAPGVEPRDHEPHSVAKLYYMAGTRSLLDAYQAAFGTLEKAVDGQTRRFDGWDDWAVTTRLDTSGHMDTVWKAISCHRSQLRDYEKLRDLSEGHWRRIFGEQMYYRVFSLVNGGRAVERDLFEGLREEGQVSA